VSAASLLAVLWWTGGFTPRPGVGLLAAFASPSVTLVLAAILVRHDEERSFFVFLGSAVVVLAGLLYYAVFLSRPPADGPAALEFMLATLLQFVGAATVCGYAMKRAGRRPPAHGIRLARADDLPLLADVERRAAALFRTYPSDLGLTDDHYRQVLPPELLLEGQRAGRLWVAEDASGSVIGFALATEVGGDAHLQELDVLPSHARHGIGSALLARACAWAAAAGYPAMTLRTFRDVPWNAPFYARRGFRIVDGAARGERYLDLERAEQQCGLRTDLRVTMCYDVDRSGGPAPRHAMNG
jgi:GNAT superfamily N-acetyltransferase